MQRSNNQLSSTQVHSLEDVVHCDFDRNAFVDVIVRHTQLCAVALDRILRDVSLNISRVYVRDRNTSLIELCSKSLAETIHREL